MIAVQQVRLLGKESAWLALIVVSFALFFVFLASFATTNTTNDHSGSRRDLQQGNIIPFYAPNQYSLQPVDSFVQYAVCTSMNDSRCLRFTNNAVPQQNEFRYQSTGPLNMQGAFWTIQRELNDLFSFTDQINFANTDLVSFAQTRHGGGVQTGFLQTDVNGYEYVVRPLGDHSWSTSANSPETYLSALDVLYLYDLTEGTLANPLAFSITPSFKIWFECFRFNFGSLTNLIAKFDMFLVTDANDPARLMYPNSVLWKRRTRYLGGLVSIEYLTVQVVDGFGRLLNPAYTQFQNDVPLTLITSLKPDGLNDRITC